MNPLRQRQLVHAILGEIRQQTGRRYEIDLWHMDETSLRALLRLLRDLGVEKQAVITRARMMPWRR